MIIEKSDIKSDIFNSIVLINGKVTRFTVLSFIKRINTFWFTGLSTLECLGFNENSQIESIWTATFGRAGLKNIEQ